jgi:antitoxin CptB
VQSDARQVPTSAAAAGLLQADALRRLRWRARRGLLENDLVVSRFLDLDGAGLAPEAAAALARLLDLSEAELLDLLLGRAALPAALEEPAVREVLKRLQSVRISP